MRFDAPTNFVAMIGAITGTLGLSLQAIGYLLKKPKLGCEKDKVFDSYWANSSKLIVESNPITSSESIAKSTDLVAISLVIKNERNLPITIESIELKKGFKLNDELIFKNPSKEFKGQPLFLLIPSAKHKFPIRLDCYDVVNLSLLYFFYKDKKSDTHKTRKERVIIKTPYKKFKFKVKIDYADTVIENKKLKDYRKTLIAAEESNIDPAKYWYSL